MILVALASAKPNGFKVVAENASLIPEDSGGGMEDPMANGDIEVRRGWFQLTLGMTPALGSYDNATLRFAFSYTSGCFRLVRYERLETHRATLDTHDLRVDYLTGKVVQSTGNDQSSEKRIERGRLKRNPRRCLDDLGSAWTFDPLN